MDTGCNSQPDPSEEKRHAFRDEGSRNEEPKSAPCAASDSITAAGLLFAAMDLLGSLVGLSNPFDKTSFNDALRRQVPVRPEAGQGCSAVVCRASADALRPLRGVLSGHATLLPASAASCLATRSSV